jgi:2-oxoglutarate dehydrogenase complex, dehydrogenase (E1) component, and related enzymes
VVPGGSRSTQGRLVRPRRTRLQSVLRKGQELLVVSRPASSSPAVGYASKHMEQQKDLINEALGSSK